MESTQRWNGHYLTNDEIHEHLMKLDDDSSNKTDNHELFMAFTLAKFLQSQENSRHVVGIPTLLNLTKPSLEELLRDNSMQSENFDKLIMDLSRPKEYIRLQIKRYMNKHSPTTVELFDYICKKTKRYGKSPELSMMFDLQVQMKLDRDELRTLLKNKEFDVSRIFAFSRLPKPKMCLIFEIFPNYTGKMWSPSD